jgi:hypothetical protein
MDARKRAYDPRIHLVRKTFLQRWMDCRVKPGHDADGVWLLVSHEVIPSAALPEQSADGGLAKLEKTSVASARQYA